MNKMYVFNRKVFLMKYDPPKILMRLDYFLLMTSDSPSFNIRRRINEFDFQVGLDTDFLLVVFDSLMKMVLRLILLSAKFCD